MNVIKAVTVGMLTSVSISDKKSGEAFLKILEPSFAPERYSDHEPIRNPYSRSKISEALSLWGFGFFWRRSKPRLLGRAWMGSSDVYNVHDAIYMSMSAKAVNEKDLLGLFEGIEARFGIDIAYINAETAADQEDESYYFSSISPFSKGLTTHDLREGLPGLCWITLLGEPYKRLFEGRLLDAPVYSISEIGDTTCLKLTEDIKDVDKKREDYMKVKSAAIEHLGSGAFRGFTAKDALKVPRFNL